MYFSTFFNILKDLSREYLRYVVLECTYLAANRRSVQNFNITDPCCNAQSVGIQTPHRELIILFLSSQSEQPFYSDFFR